MKEKKQEVIVEITSQIRLAISILEEKLSRVVPFKPSQIVIKNGEITVKE